MAILFVSGRTKSVRELADLSKEFAAEGASLPATIDRLRGKYAKQRKGLEAMARDARMSPLAAQLQESVRADTEKTVKLFTAGTKLMLDRLAESLLGDQFRTPTAEESLEVMYEKLKKGKD
jgi:hypothetical protein